MSTHPLSIGHEFLGYRIEGLIGQGGMGVVYLASDLRLKRRVALKLMAPEVALDERFRERFARESELAMSLEHPHVVPIHDAGETDGRLYLVMRHVEGSDLRTLLREQGALDPVRALRIVRQVADALDVAHANGLVHRDVKPSNVLLDDRGHVYLADFGLSRRIAEPGSDLGGTHSLGTPAYLAPEQIEGEPVDRRADIYSLGCLLFECLTREAPFVRDTRLGVIWAHLEEEPPSTSERRPGIPAAIDAVIRKAMAKPPEERYSTCAELVSAAEEALGLGRTRAPRRRAILVLVGAIVVVLAALAAAVASRGGEFAAASGLGAVGADTLVRLDPATNEIRAVIEVGENPVAAAVGGARVWVLGESSVSEIDPATNEVTHTTALSSNPITQGYLGPILAADDAGAWTVGFDFERLQYVLTRVLRGGRGKRELHLGQEPVAVEVGEGAVWVLARAFSGDSVLRIDPATGAVTASARLPRSRRISADGIDVGAGAVWVTESHSAKLYRIDARTVRLSGARDLGTFSSLPVVGYEAVWVCVANPGSTMLRIDPRTMRDTLARYTIPADEGRFAPGYGSMWRHDVPSGSVMRFQPQTGELTATIRVTPAPPEPAGGGLAPTSIAVGADGVWVPIARG